MPPSCAVWADLQSMRGLRCYGNIMQMQNVSEYMLVLTVCLVLLIDPFKIILQLMPSPCHGPILVISTGVSCDMFPHKNVHFWVTLILLPIYSVISPEIKEWVFSSQRGES